MNGQYDESVSNLDWFKQELQTAKFRERLDYLAGEIAYAKWDGEVWAQDDETLRELRELYSSRAREILQAMT